MSKKKSSNANWIESTLERAIQHHKQNQLTQAEELYRAILQKQPRHAHALHCLGLIAQRTRHYDMAEQLILRSIEEDPAFAMYYSNLGALFIEQNKFEPAIQSLNKAIRLKPDYADAMANLGKAWHSLQRLTEAADWYRKAIDINPTLAEAYNGLGSVLHAQNDYQGAIENFQHATRIHPRFVAAYSNLAVTYGELRQYDNVISCCQKVIELEPDQAENYQHLGLACQELGQLPMSEGFFQRALALKPQNPNYHWGLGLTRLAMGKLDQGWTGYEYRWQKIDPITRQNFPYPIWQGENLPDKTILVWGEQGIGDQIMFASMYNDVLPRFRKTVFACAAKLVSLYARSFPQADVVALENTERLSGYDSGIDVQSAAGSLTRWLRPEVSSFPRDEFYLMPDPQRVRYWKDRLASLGPELNVGICWRSGNMTGNRSLYCSSLEQWGAIFAINGVRFINLQYDECEGELTRARQLFGTAIHGFPEVDLYNDIDEAAALTRAMDMVISAPTAAGILAAAVGVPTWVMTSGFNWQKFGTAENCWYGTLHSFDKSWVQDWDVIIEKVAHQLQHYRDASRLNPAE